MAERKSLVVPLLIGGGVLIALTTAVAKQREIRLFIAAGFRKIMDEANKLIFKAQLPDRAKPYGDLILRVAAEQNVDPFVLFALGDRETNWGATSAYKQQTGDWTPRCRTAAQIAKYPGLYRVVGSCAGGSSVMPGDGLGWGRGIAQIDWEQGYPWCQNNDWRDDYKNLTRGAQILKTNLDYFAKTPNSSPVVINDYYAEKLQTEPGEYVDPRPMWGEDLVAAALSAYNSGIGQTLLCVAAGRPADYLTTGKDYAQDTMGRATTLAVKFDTAGGTAA